MLHPTLTAQYKTLSIKLLPSLELLGVLLFVTLLINTTTAHADFRKALDAYVARDGATMLKEVKDAVEQKNDDGLMLFLSVLDIDESLIKNDAFLSREEVASKGNTALSIQAPIALLLENEALKRFFGDLEKAVNKSSIESQYRFYWLASLAKMKLNFDVLGRIESDSKFPSSTYAEFSRAMSYLVEQKPAKNEAKGMWLLKQAIARPDAEFYWARFSNGLSQLYFKKYDQTQDVSNLRQAYAWAMIDLTSNGIRTFGIQDVVDEMQKQNLLIKVAPEMHALLSDIPESIKKEIGVSDRERVRKRNAQILAGIKGFELPELIENSHKIDLTKQPVMSLRRVVGENVMDSSDVAASSTVLNYFIDVYEDGRVNFNLGPKGINGFYRTKNSETLVKVAPKEVDELILKIEKMGFNEAPLFNSTAVNSCLSTACLSYVGNNMGAIDANYFITLRSSRNCRTIKFKGQLNSEPPQIFTRVFHLVEQSFPTRQYRCGTNKQLAYYEYCVSREYEVFHKTKQGEEK